MISASGTVRNAFLISFFCLAAQSAAAETEFFVAGANPSQRPKDAPIITDIEKGASWYDTALQGIDQPYPNSLRFLEDQGNWYTPFNRPGMTGRYDIRNWHPEPNNP